MLRRTRSSRSLGFASWLTLAFLVIATTARAQWQGAWTRLDSEDAAPSDRRQAATAYDSNRHRLLVFGGGMPLVNDVWALDLDSQVWEQIHAEDHPPSPRCGATALFDAANDRLVIFGGY